MRTICIQKPFRRVSLRPDATLTDLCKPAANIFLASFPDFPEERKENGPAKIGRPASDRTSADREQSLAAAQRAAAGLSQLIARLTARVSATTRQSFPQLHHRAGGRRQAKKCTHHHCQHIPAMQRQLLPALPRPRQSRHCDHGWSTTAPAVVRRPEHSPSREPERSTLPDPRLGARSPSESHFPGVRRIPNGQPRGRRMAWLPALGGERRGARSGTQERERLCGRLTCDLRSRLDIRRDPGPRHSASRSGWTHQYCHAPSH